MVGTVRPWLKVYKLQAHLLGRGDASERPSWSRLAKMFKAIEGYDYGLEDCLNEACAEDHEMDLYVKDTYDYVRKEIPDGFEPGFCGLLGNPARRRWVALRAAVRLLAVHKRAAVSANHPSRKRDRGEFEVGDM